MHLGLADPWKILKVCQNTSYSIYGDHPRAVLRKKWYIHLIYQIFLELRVTVDDWFYGLDCQGLMGTALHNPTVPRFLSEQFPPRIIPNFLGGKSCPWEIVPLQKVPW